MVSVYLCDDLPEIRALVRAVLEEDAHVQVVGDSGDASTGIEEIAELQPDVVLLDLSMPGMDGLEALPLIKRVAPSASVIVFSGFSAERMRAVSLASGAARYIEKGEPLEHVRDAVLEVTSGRSGP